MPHNKENQSKHKYKTLRVNNLTGRFLHVANPASRRNILVVYDEMMSLEMIQTFCESLSKYGSVTAVDLPGNGGMTSLHKIKQDVTYDNYASYLASFLSLRYRTQKITVVGIGLGATIAFRMLQKHPVICKRITKVVALNGFTHVDDFGLSRLQRQILLIARSITATSILTRASGLAASYRNLRIRRIQNLNLSKEYLDTIANALKISSSYTYAKLQKQQLALNLCRQNIDTPVLSVTTSSVWRDMDSVQQATHMDILCKRLTMAQDDRELLEILGSKTKSNSFVSRHIKYFVK